MSKAVVTATTLVTEDGVPIDAAHLRGPGDLAIVVAHGFTLSWQRPDVWRIASRLNDKAGVVIFDFRGHGRSGGMSTLGNLEIKDLDVAVAWARELGYQRIATVGFSMGASVVLRHAGLIGGVNAAVSVSGPGRWYYRGTERMRRVHLAVEHRLGRVFTRRVLKTRVSPQRWDPVPVPPAEAAARISPVPLLIVHGDKDQYFPPEHARQLYAAAREPKELWLLPGMGHAESATTPELADQIADWIDKVTAQGAAALAPVYSGSHSSRDVTQQVVLRSRDSTRPCPTSTTVKWPGGRHSEPAHPACRRRGAHAVQPARPAGSRLRDHGGGPLSLLGGRACRRLGAGGLRRPSEPDQPASARCRQPSR
jgi:pimeloyl-ACP methyl ester carboxylesterase